MDNKSPWPFQDLPGTVCVTTKRVTSRRLPIVYASRAVDEENKLFWQFQCAEGFQLDDAQLVGLKTVFAVDPSIGELADLPLGYEATRESLDTPWIRRPRLNG
jgi:hypothetical protein